MPIPGTRPSRRLAAIWFADVVGYSALAAEDENRAVALIGLFESTVAACLKEHDGRLVKLVGDAAVAEFGSTEAAVEAALDLREHFSRVSAEAGTPSELRIGVHIGEVVVTAAGDLLGEGVNTAKRIQSAAAPQEVLVSDDVWHQLRTRRAFSFEPRGPHRLRGAEHERLLYAVAASGSDPPSAGSAARKISASPPDQGHGSIRLMVLPFKMLRPDPTLDFLTYSLTDAIICNLARVRSLVVRSSVASQQFAGNVDLAQLAHQAQVDAVLTGTLYREGARLAVRSQLTRTHDGTLLWSAAEQIELDDLFGLQESLSRSIVASVGARLSAGDDARLRTDIPANGKIYELYLRANQLSITVQGLESARDVYLQCLAMDSEFAPAWANLGRCYRLLAKYSTDDVASRQQLLESERALQRALELNPDLSLAHSLYAALEVDLGRPVEGMLRLLGRLRVEGDNLALFTGLVHATRFCGLLEASCKADAEARRLDPLARTSVPHTLFMAGRYEEALDQYNNPDIGYMEALALAALNRKEEAIEMLGGRLTEGKLPPSLHLLLRSLQALLEGDEASGIEAIKGALPDQSRAGVIDAERLFFMVRQLSQLGAREIALDQLRKVINGGYYPVFTLEHDPWLANIRSAAAFHSIFRHALQLHRQAAAAYVGAGGPELVGGEALQL